MREENFSGRGRNDGDGSPFLPVDFLILPAYATFQSEIIKKLRNST
jgi:hypothetical protein